jgi:GMP synthase-like glutamine amidotransferase
MKEKIVVLFAANMIDRSIVKFLETEFEVSVIDMNPERLKKVSEDDVNLLKTVDLMIFTGGEDVDPERYYESRGKNTYVNKKRDQDEFLYLYPESTKTYFMSSIPKLGICRGAQLLTVYNGGKLIQHVEGHKNNEQVIETTSGTTYTISSDHHQMMNPFELKKNSYELIAWSKYFQSNQYLNGKNENIKLPKNFLESEIIYYNNSNSLCIQPHPEWCIGSKGSEYCLKLINKYLLKKSIANKKTNEEFVDYSVPLGMNSIPHGWMRSGVDGNSYIFNGESFILASSYNYVNEIGIKTTSKNATKPIQDSLVDDYFSFLSNTEEQVEPSNNDGW